jgi:glycosyltransferase involved in cell wall biosynthesis
MIVGIFLFHHNINQITQVIFATSTINFLGVISLHFIKRNSAFILRNIIDLIDLFADVPNQKSFSPDSKRVLIFNWRDTHHAYAGGAEVYLHELAKRWVERGFSVTQFCGNDGHTPRNEVVDGVQVIRRGGFYFVYFWAFWYYLLRFRGRIDIIIDCQNGIPFFAPLYAKEKIYCLMFHVHQEVFRRSLSKPLAAFASILENRLMPWAYRQTRFITISKSSKKEMESWDIGEAGIEIVYPGIDLNKFGPAKKSERPLVVYVGRLQVYKSVHILIKAARRIIKKNSNVRFAIAGDGEERKRLVNLVEKLDLQDKVSFLGRISDQKKVELYQKAWVFVNPSLMEGWGITSIEANACGTPVVASDVPGLRDSVRNPSTGYLVKYGSPKAFAQKILKLINNQDLRNQMQQKSIAWAKNFEWDKSAQRSLKIIS